MSDLQTSLLAVGALIVAGVYLFNWWQERSFRHKAEQAFAGEHEDVLLRGAAPEAPPMQGRAEPRLGPAPQRAVAGGAALAIDPIIDYVVEVAIPAPVDGADLRDELLALTATWGKPVLVAGSDERGSNWTEAGAGSGDKYPRLRFALQMVNRAGCITQAQLAAFRGAVARWAERLHAEMNSSDVATAHATAVQLDRFCADVDIAVGINVVSSDGNPFPGSKIRALAEAAGFRLEPDGVFYFRDEQGRTLFALDNHEPMPFVPEQMNTLVTGGITLLLDVPRIAGALRAFETMLETAGNLAAALGGVLVDDNRAALSDGAIDKIRGQLRSIIEKMEAGQVAAGGARALRLFS